MNFKISSACDKGCGCGCVGVAFEGDKVHVTNTTVPGGAVASFTQDEWKAFISGVKKGEFDI